MSQPETSPTCAPFIERLVDGVSPANDVALREHISSCLWCRRAETELASADRLAVSLRTASAENPQNPQENNDLFWAALHARTLKAWDRSQPGPAQRRQRLGLGAAATMALGAAAVWLLSLDGNTNPTRTTATQQAATQYVSQTPSDRDLDLDLDLGEFRDEELRRLNALLDLAMAEESGISDGPMLATGDPMTGLSDTESLFVLSGTELATLSQQLTTDSALSNP
jgi:hypothetical protein